jgi:hypothetical protein
MKTFKQFLEKYGDSKTNVEELTLKYEDYKRVTNHKVVYVLPSSLPELSWHNRNDIL